MVKNIVVIGSSGFIGKSFVKNIKSNKFLNVYLCKSLSDLSLVPKKYTLLFAAGKFFGSDDDLWSSNVSFLRLVLKKFIETKGNQFIYLSSGAVYDLKSKEKSKECDLPNPKTFYGLTKLIAETNVIFKAKQHNFNFQIIRLPNVYGKNQKKGVVFNFIKNIEEKKPFLIKGNGKDVRDFLHINDLLNAINLIIKNNVQNGVYNISSNLSLSVLELANLISENKKYPKLFIENDNESLFLNLDFHKAWLAFGYEPKINNLNFIE